MEIKMKLSEISAHEFALRAIGKNNCGGIFTKTDGDKYALKFYDVYNILTVAPRFEAYAVDHDIHYRKSEGLTRSHLTQISITFYFTIIT